MTTINDYKNIEKRKEYLKKYQKKYMRKWRKEHPLTEEQKIKYRIRHRGVMKKKREKIISLFGGCCSICGYKRCFGALEFHHKDRNQKEKAVSKKNSLDKMLLEAKKCILVCSNCHKEIHEKEYL